jgi:hypothetical protein
MKQGTGAKNKKQAHKKREAKAERQTAVFQEGM